MAGFHGWLVFLHVLFAFAFVFGHGTAAAVMLRLRRERDPGRVRLLLDVSRRSSQASTAAALVLIVFGVWAGIDGGWFTNGQLWLWAAIGLLVLVTALMYVLVAKHFYAWREALAKDPPPSEAEVAAMLSTPQPLWGSALGAVGFVLILWLMTLKPF